VLYGPWNSSFEAEVGIDADYDHRWWTTGPERVIEWFKKYSLEAAANNVTYLAGLYYLGHEVDYFNYTRAVHESGGEQNHTPSPVDETYWLRIVEEPALIVANLSLYYPIRGLTWDFELYLHDGPWERTDYTYDEPALMAFANETGREIPHMNPSSRKGYLQARELLEEFHQWQATTLYKMAKSTEEKVHAINPDLLLGDLNLRDSWFHWTLGKAWSTPDVPFVSWTLDTYPGYNEKRMAYLRKNFEEREIHGIVIPGFYTIRLNPWRLLEDMETATRRDGAFWVYQYNGYPYLLADEHSYAMAYKILDRYIYFDESKAQILPEFSIFPGAEARPYLGPDNITLFIRHVASLELANEVSIASTSTDMTYIGNDFSIIPLSSTNLNREDIPCIITGLPKGDLVPTRALSFMRELGTILGYCRRIGLEGLDSIEAEYDLAVIEFERGNYGEVDSKLEPLLDQAYAEIIDLIWPMVEEGIKSPRNSPIPMSPLMKLTSAERSYGEGDQFRGNVLMLAGLGEWSEAVIEPYWALFLPVGVLASRKLSGS
jgi:hypothetical protein